MSGFVTNEGQEMCVQQHALLCTKHIKAKHPRQLVYLWGQIAKSGFGSEVDLILEVPGERFETFRMMCANRRVPWIWAAEEPRQKSIIKGCSVVAMRTNAALEVLGASSSGRCCPFQMARDVGLAVEQIRVTAMPSGWKRSLALRNRIQRDLPKGHGGYDMEEIVRQVKILVV